MSTVASHAKHWLSGAPSDVGSKFQFSRWWLCVKTWRAHMHLRMRDGWLRRVCCALQARLRAMEGKILKGAARGGLVELTKMKEHQLKRREEELQRR